MYKIFASPWSISRHHIDPSILKGVLSTPCLEGLVPTETFKHHHFWLVFTLMWVPIIGFLLTIPGCLVVIHLKPCLHRGCSPSVMFTIMNFILKLNQHPFVFHAWAFHKIPFLRDVRHLYISDVPNVLYVPDQLFSVWIPRPSRKPVT